MDWLRESFFRNPFSTNLLGPEVATHESQKSRVAGLESQLWPKRKNILGNYLRQAKGLKTALAKTQERSIP